MNVIAWLGLKLAYEDVPDQYVSYYTTVTNLLLICKLVHGLPQEFDW